MAAFPRDGCRDLRARLQIAWYWAVRLRVRRELSQAEARLGFLGWEQVEFYDEEVAAQARKIEEFENTQASLENASAELSARKTALDDELARERALNDQAQVSLAAEREPIAARLQQAEAARRLKLGAVERFERAIAEVAGLEKEFETQSMAFMKVVNPDIEIRTEARRVSDELLRLADERKRLEGDKLSAARESAALESDIARLHGELQRLDDAAAAARDRLEAASRRIGGEMRLLDRKRRKSALGMSRLDRKKRQPYRFIGACLADHGIAPLNQPEILERVQSLRERDAVLTQTITSRQAVCAATDPGILIAFYLLLAAILFALCALGARFL